VTDPGTAPTPRSRARLAVAAPLAVAVVVVLIVVLVVVVVHHGGGPDCGGEQPARAGGGHWTCTFDDEFSGDSLDRSEWTVTTTKATGYRAGPECYVDDAANIGVRGGDLVLTAQRLRSPMTCAGPLGGSFRTSYTSGAVSTRGHFAQAYGRFEIRARFPADQHSGVHSALWLYPARLTYGGGGTSGEIDIGEYYSKAPQVVYPTVKYHPANPTTKLTAGCLVDQPWRWHVYAVEWTDTTITFVYDGKACWSTGWRAAAPLVHPAPFDRPFNIHLTQALGAGTNVVDPALAMPLSMEVDYVRAWR
jgi:beta-glucanase (GH16 family)